MATVSSWIVSGASLRSLLAIPIFVFCGTKAEAVEQECRHLDPVLKMSGHPIYSDRSGSTIDTAGLYENQTLIFPVRAYNKYLLQMLEHPTERPTKSELACIKELFHSWAQAGALLEKPDNSSGNRERERFSFGIFILYFKYYRLTGVAIPEVLNWFTNLSHEIMKDFSSKAKIDNLHVWAGATVAAAALTTHDQSSMRYADDIFKIALSQIDENGLLTSELRRKSRAVLYHHYYYSALLVLLQIEKAQGVTIGSGELAAVGRLAAQVHGSLCGTSSVIAVESGAFNQEAVPSGQLAIDFTFGRSIVPNNWQLCVRPASPDGDETLGGRLDRTMELLGRSD